MTNLLQPILLVLNIHGKIVGTLRKLGMVSTLLGVEIWFPHHEATLYQHMIDRPLGYEIHYRYIYKHFFLSIILSFFLSLFLSFLCLHSICSPHIPNYTSIICRSLKTTFWEIPCDNETWQWKLPYQWKCLAEKIMFFPLLCLTTREYQPLYI